MPHADNSPGNASWSPDEHYQSRIEPPNRYKTKLTVVATVIRSREMEPRKDLSGPAHIEASLLKRALALQRIAGNAHIYCSYV